VVAIDTRVECFRQHEFDERIAFIPVWWRAAIAAGDDMNAAG